jgi:methylated-DNA-[protein]-cysteine S-methyltransferase
MLLHQDEVGTPIGRLALAALPEGGALVAVDWVDFQPRTRALLEARFGSVRFESRPLRPVRDAFEAFFARQLTALDSLEISLGGTPFQRQVWTALRAVRPGETMSYGELAAAIGRPQAARAVGLANSLNPVALVLPCHRIIGANGALTGYAGGLERKRWLLAHEQGARVARPVEVHA